MIHKRFAIVLEFYLGLFFFFTSSQLLSAEDRIQSGPIYDAVGFIVNEMRGDLKEISEKTPSAALVSITVSENLGEDVKEHFLKRLEGINDPKSTFRFVQCKECMSVRAETESDNVYIKKGITSDADFTKFVQPLGTKSYAEANLIYTGTKLTLAVNFYNLQDKALIFSKTYSKRVLHSQRSGMKTSITFVQFIAMDSAQSYPFGGNILFAERIYGMGEFGLGLVGHTNEGATKSYFSLGPNLRLNINEISDSPSSWGAYLITFRMHYGWYGGSQRDLSFGTGLKVEVGSVFHLLLEVQTAVSLDSEKDKKSETQVIDGKKVSTSKQSPTELLLGFGFDVG